MDMEVCIFQNEQYDRMVIFHPQNPADSCPDSPQKKPRHMTCYIPRKKYQWGSTLQTPNKDTLANDD